VFCNNAKIIKLFLRGATALISKVRYLVDIFPKVKLVILGC